MILKKENFLINMAKRLSSKEEAGSNITMMEVIISISHKAILEVQRIYSKSFSEVEIHLQISLMMKKMISLVEVSDIHSEEEFKWDMDSEGVLEDLVKIRCKIIINKKNKEESEILSLILV